MRVYLRRDSAWPADRLFVRSALPVRLVLVEVSQRLSRTLGEDCESSRLDLMKGFPHAAGKGPTDRDGKQSVRRFLRSATINRSLRNCEYSRQTFPPRVSRSCAQLRRS